MKETIDPIAVAIDVFNTELAKTDLSDFQKAVVRDWVCAWNYGG